MHALLEFLLRHGYVLLLGWVFAEQAGLPLPSVPLLLAAGVLAGTGRLNFELCLLASMLAAVSADTMWYRLGRQRGIRILQWICKISLEPDSCVRRTEGIFEKYGAKSLLFAKFLPGLNTVATPLAGVFHMGLRRFLVFDALGALVWSGTFLGLGFVFSEQIERIAENLRLAGGGAMALAIAGLALYILYKILARKKFLRDLRVARITVDELKEKLDSGEPLAIVDLRHSMDFETDPETIPGAFRVDAKELEQKGNSLPHDRDIILYCT
jgi:membrane protein DedA with SNARE-associated domain